MRITVESFHWDKQFETGLPEVDKQHHILVDLINHFGELLTKNEDISHDEIETVFGELAAYAQYHFQEEENMMQREGLDSCFFEKHKNLHNVFLQELTQMHEGVSPQQQDTAKSLLKFLIYWLAFHILGTDQSMARQVSAIHSGQKAADAYRDETRMKEASTEPLLLALNGLFQQVSERNRELLELNRTLEEKVAERTHALSEANHRLEEMALTDVLTGLPNRRHAMASLAQCWSESLRDGTPLVCMMIDADGFKQINDNYGHDAGDEVLRQLSKNMRNSVRTDDTVCRLGGDEFLIICAGTQLEGALHIAEIMRQNVAAMRVPAGSGVWQGSISAGVAARTPEMRGPEDLIKAADEGVYIAKRNGRNRVACASADADFSRSE
jgi:diguanylate cyclase (GGDEF)-like protein/hemerythrin-like metal-binding protein